MPEIDPQQQKDNNKPVILPDGSKLSVFSKQEENSWDVGIQIQGPGYIHTHEITLFSGEEWNRSGFTKLEAGKQYLSKGEGEYDQVRYNYSPGYGVPKQPKQEAAPDSTVSDDPMDEIINKMLDEPRDNSWQQISTSRFSEAGKLIINDYWSSQDSENFTHYEVVSKTAKITNTGHLNSEPSYVQADYYDIKAGNKVHIEFDKNGDVLKREDAKKLTKDDLEYLKGEYQVIKETVNRSMPLESKKFPLNDPAVKDSLILEKDDTGGYIDPKHLKNKVDELIKGTELNLANKAPEKALSKKGSLEIF